MSSSQFQFLVIQASRDELTWRMKKKQITIAAAGPQRRVQGCHGAAGRDDEDAERALGDRVLSEPGK